MARDQARRRLHQGLVGERSLVGSRYLADADLRRAYDADLAPRTAAALTKVLGELGLAGVTRALDLGAGTGAAGAVLRASFPGVKVVAVDQVAGPGVVQADLAHAGRPRGVEGRFDLVVAAHLLNELAPRLSVPARAGLVTSWCDELLTEQGTCMVIEPALHETSRALLEVRDVLVSRGLFIAAPCLWQGGCPALGRERDWCHDAAPAVVAGRSRVDFSYLAVRRSGVAPIDPALYRVVSDPLVDKGRRRLYGCGPAGRPVMLRLNRDRSPENAVFDDAVRGEVITVGAAPSGESLRIERQTAVRRRGQVPAA